MKIISVVGARPQFIKLSVVSREIRRRHKEIIIHTGQHYDLNMSDNFFKELDIPRPDINLGIGSMPYASQIAAMMQSLEGELSRINPDMIMLYGDTNSTLAGALTASKMRIPAAHVEAGLRSFNMRMREEINRVATDHISSFLFCPSNNAVDNLRRENVRAGVFNVGDVMLDSLKYFKDKIKRMVLDKYHLQRKRYHLATIHRAENTDNLRKLKIILDAFTDSGEKILFPVHPRTKKMIKRGVRNLGANVILIEPVGYLDMLSLEGAAKKIITDSGGVQKEAYYLKVPCLTIREETEWTETVNCGANKLLPINKKIISGAITEEWDRVSFTKNLYGDGTAAKKILSIIDKTADEIISLKKGCL